MRRRRRGRPPKDDRLMFEAMVFLLRTGIPWRDLPARYGPWNSVYTRWRRWCQRGLWPRMSAVLSPRAQGKLRFLDASRVEGHRDKWQQALTGIDRMTAQS